MCDEPARAELGVLVLKPSVDVQVFDWCRRSAR